MQQHLLWAVYERSDGGGCVVLALRQLADGTCGLTHPPDVDIAPLPISVHDQRHAADRAAGMLLHDCAGSA